jgi:hypothetical protein
VPPAAPRAAREDYELIDDAASGAEATSSRRLRRKEAYVVIAGQFRAFVNKHVNLNDAIDEGTREKLGLRPYRRKRVPCSRGKRLRPFSSTALEFCFAKLHALLRGSLLLANCLHGWGERGKNAGGDAMRRINVWRINGVMCNAG